MEFPLGGVHVCVLSKSKIRPTHNQCLCSNRELLLYVWVIGISVLKTIYSEPSTMFRCDRMPPDNWRVHVIINIFVQVCIYMRLDNWRGKYIRIDDIRYVYIYAHSYRYISTYIYIYTYINVFKNTKKTTKFF